jgi:hypothetical protein
VQQHTLFFGSLRWLKKQAAIARVKLLTLTQIPNLREDVTNLREEERYHTIVTWQGPRKRKTVDNNPLGMPKRVDKATPWVSHIFNEIWFE